MSDIDQFVEGVVASIFGILVTMILFLSVGLPSEMTLTVFEGIDVFNVPAEWDTYSQVLFMQTVMYIAICTPALLGLGLLILQIIRREPKDIKEVQYYEGGVL